VRTQPLIEFDAEFARQPAFAIWKGALSHDGSSSVRAAFMDAEAE
jgi:hypothetical protein